MTAIRGELLSPVIARVSLETWDRAREGDRDALKAIYLELGRLEGLAMTEYRRGWQDCLDQLGAPKSEAAPMERLIHLRHRLERLGGSCSGLAGSDKQSDSGESRPMREGCK